MLLITGQQLSFGMLQVLRAWGNPPVHVIFHMVTQPIV